VRSLLRVVRTGWNGLHRKPEIVSIPASGDVPFRGRVLYSYLKDPLLPQPATYFDGHTNKWESREIARLLVNLGYQVDAVDWSAGEIAFSEDYQVVFDIHLRQQALLPRMPDALRLLHLTGSDWRYQNRAELVRVRNLEARRGRRYAPRRQVAHSDLMERALEVADHCSLIGNEHTLSTYPAAYSHKFTKVPVTASPSFVKSADELVPNEREFLWFFGGGLVHKGLDLVLEAFARDPSLRLNVIGDVAAESDFVEIYRKELFELENITVHGFLTPNEPRFRRILEKCFCFIAPSCSESISTAAATCMQVGLYPLVSRDTGISLPQGTGTYLEQCSIEEILSAAATLKATDRDTLREQIRLTQFFAQREYSRPNFTARMKAYLDCAIASYDTLQSTNGTPCRTSS
jgi:glycosyltransferase involved in cell wall biosynthesis